MAQIDGEKMKPDLRILLSGASGFVGANLARALQQEGYDVHALARPASGSFALRRELLEALPKTSRRDIDLADAHAVFEWVRTLKPDVLIHLAMYGGNPGQDDAAKIRQVNVEGTRNILRALNGAPNAIFIHTGSSSEYGPSLRPMREGQECHPAGEYGKTKLEATQMVRAWAAENKRRAGILRLFSPFGEYDHPFRLIPSVMLSCIRHQELALSSPSPVRDFVHIDDVVSAYITLVQKLQEQKFAGGEVFNVGSGAQHSVRQTAESIVRLLGSDISIKYGEASIRGAESGVWQADLAKSARVLGWKPALSFEQGLKKTCQWFKTHQSLYGD